MNLDSFHKLYVHELKDLYSAESQILDALPKMIETASNNQLKEGFEHHLRQTKTHLERLETIFKELEFEPGGHKCSGMEGLLKEAEDLMKEEMPDEVKDAALVAASQRVEHYEMAGYGTAAAFAEKLGHYKQADILIQTLEEEAMADRRLSRVASRALNFLALTS